MEQVFERVCGLDVHKATIAACVRGPDAKGRRVQYVQTFGTTTADLLALRDWLEAHGVIHVAMESTGVYWKPVYYVLEERATCLLVNAAHVKGSRAGRPTCRTVRGSRNCWSTACCGEALCRQRPSASSVISHVTGSR